MSSQTVVPRCDFNPIETQGEWIGERWCRDHGGHSQPDYNPIHCPRSSASESQVTYRAKQVLVQGLREEYGEDRETWVAMRSADRIVGRLKAAGVLRDD